MGRGGNQLFDDSRDVFLSVACLGSQWGNVQDVPYLPRGGLFASVNLMGTGDNSNLKSLYNDLYVKYLSFVGFQEEEGVLKKKKGGLKLKIKVKNPSLRRLISGGIAGAISRTAVAPLETIRTHLMVGSSGHSTTEVFKNIMQTDGWKGLFRGNLVNVIRVAPSKAIEGFKEVAARCQSYVDCNETGDWQVSTCRLVELLDTHSLAVVNHHSSELLQINLL